MRKWLFWPYQVYFWLIFIPLLVVLTMLAATLAAVSAVLISPRFGSRQFAARWARWIAYLIPMPVTVRGAENYSSQQSYVVVCNHQSQCDILVAYGWLNLDLKWVMKQELRKIPGIGIGCEKLGHIFVDRSRPEQARAAINTAVKKLGEGVGLLFFPEGTRSMDGRLLPFKKGAFKIALEQQMPLLPVSIKGTRAVLPNKTLRLFPGRVELIIHPALETSGKSIEQLEELRDTARQTIAQGLK